MKTGLRTFYVLLSCAVLFAGQQDANAQSADQIIKRIQDKYQAIDALKAEFTQTMTTPYSEGSETFSGTVVLQGDRYRVETGNQTLVTDGKVTWIYNPADNQVLINDVVEDETSFSFNDFLFSFDENYTATSVKSELIGGVKHFRVDLKPRDDDSFFREATLWLRDSDDVVTRLQVLDVNDTQMTFELTNIELNPKLDASTFTFQPPRSAEVVDLRS
jgi:outer membrane lipoprotein carrier protein